MPKRPEFDLNSETIAPVYGRVGVLEFGETKVPIIGAYYDRDPNFSGLYIITSSEVKYFEIDPENLQMVGLTGYASFFYQDTEYLIRELDQSDGLWMSKYKTELPIPVLQQMLITKSSRMISKLSNTELPDLPIEFEALYVYYRPDSDRVSAIIYMSSYGVFTRNGADWQDVNLNIPELQDLTTEDVDPEKAEELINLYDDNFDIMSVKVAKKYALESREVK